MIFTQSRISLRIEDIQNIFRDFTENHGLSTKAADHLINLHCGRIEDVPRVHREIAGGLMKVYHLGPKTFSEIKLAVERAGLKLE